MLIDEWFNQLHAELAAIEQNWPKADEDGKRSMAEQLVRLRRLSDQIVDSWLVLEEKLALVLKQVNESEQQAQSQAASDEAEAFEKAAHALLFRKGEGFYHLRLFHDAKHHFAQLLKHSPDWENGRLYYGYSLLFCGEREAALREFRLLSRTASSRKVKAISHNALGCMVAEERHWLEAAQAFQSALETMPDYPEATFNLALCYLQNGDAQEALETIERYLDGTEEDWEAEVLWLRARQLLQTIDPTSRRVPPHRLRLPMRQLDAKTLAEMAKVYEERGQIRRAQLCYRYLAELLPQEGWVWHGLAWNSWLVAGADAAIPLLKKAITLAPDNLDFLFSYGWILLFAGDLTGARRVFAANLRRDSEHTLSRSGMITVCSKQGEWAEAKRLAQELLQAENSYVRALGHYHLGRIAVACEEWQQAEEHFLAASGKTHDLWEVPLFLQLCANKLGRRNGQTSADSLLPH
ncbi:tetratricopeptide repeat protein [Brevibacillus marinus]|uniref:tetratricopeptide repeat protein n=1 Tax=Brevibacillus marinus TaxID=2496837 RepID=UPI000F842105|nr:tetratricopeptide repeat protein [Brevibacillus marinus]